MLKFKLNGGLKSTSTNKLPPLERWFSSEDEEFFTYNWNELIELKTQLNKVKKQIDPIYKTYQGRTLYNNITREIYPLENLRTNGRIKIEYNAEIVTKAWLKFYELLHHFIRPSIAKNREFTTKNREFTTKNKELYSFHVAEAPGAFLVALNHFLKTKFSNEKDFSLDKWHWFAESYKILESTVFTGKYYLWDTYGLIKAYPKNWIFGVLGDGDITSSDNIRSFKHKIQTNFERLDLYTSDVKFVPLVLDYDEEESQNMVVHIGHTLCLLETLSKGGNAILKTFTYFESFSISLLLLLQYCFEELYVTKPNASRKFNSETYIVGLSYKKNLMPLEIAKIYEFLEFARENPNKKLALFQKNDIPSGFLKKVKKISEQLQKKQIESIQYALSMYNKYKNKPLGILSKDMMALREQAAKQWIKTNQIEKIEDKDKMLPTMSKSPRGWKRALNRGE